MPTSKVLVTSCFAAAYRDARQNCPTIEEATDSPLPGGTRAGTAWRVCVRTPLKPPVDVTGVNIPAVPTQSQAVAAHTANCVPPFCPPVNRRS